jgi:CheY-like chemotaxis protein
MSHEIRTPMTAILGFADLLIDHVADDDAEVVEAAATIKRNGQYLLSLIDTILGLSEIESGRCDAEWTACSPRQIVSEVASLMRVPAATKNLSLDVDYIGPIPETIRSDRTRLRQILVNLIGNAIKFTEVGTVQLITRMLDADGDAPQIQFETIDTGIGMDTSELARVFEPFVQADGTANRKFGGTGLGLTIGKRLAETLGGDLTVESQPGCGSTFRLTIPTGPLDGIPMLDDPAEAFVAEHREVEVQEASQHRLEGRVLLAEDGPDNQRLMAFLLRRAGADVTIAENGELAVEMLQSATHGAQSPDSAQDCGFDIILMDMQMPVMDGYEATRRLREAGYGGPVIAVTAHATKDDRRQCLEAGCDDYLAKPIQREVLLALVQKHLNMGAKVSTSPPLAGSSGDAPTS